MLFSSPYFLSEFDHSALFAPQQLPNAQDSHSDGFLRREPQREEGGGGQDHRHRGGDCPHHEGEEDASSSTAGSRSAHTAGVLPTGPEGALNPLYCDIHIVAPFSSVLILHSRCLILRLPRLSHSATTYSTVLHCRSSRSALKR